MVCSCPELLTMPNSAASLPSSSEYVSTSPRIIGYNGSAHIHARRRVLDNLPGPARLRRRSAYQGPGRGTPGRCWPAGALRTFLYESCRAVFLSSPSASSYMAVARSTLPPSPATGVYLLVTCRRLHQSVAPVIGTAAPVPLPGDGALTVSPSGSVQGSREWSHPPGAATCPESPCQAPPRW